MGDAIGTGKTTQEANMAASQDIVERKSGGRAPLKTETKGHSYEKKRRKECKGG